MTKSKIVRFAIFSLMLVIFIGCASEELSSAKMYISDKDWDNAEIYLVKALAIEPENPEILYLLGDLIYGQNENWDKMNEMFNKALSIDPEKSITAENKVGKVGDFIAMAKERYWVTVYNQGIGYFQEFQTSKEGKDSAILQDAIKSFKTAIEIIPEGGQAYGSLSRCLLLSDDLDGAIEIVTTGVAKDHNNFSLNMTAGEMYGAADDKESALIYYRKAVDIDSTNLTATQQLAQTYYDLGEKELSLETYENAISHITDNIQKADFYYNLGVLNMQLGDFQQAEDNFSLAYDYNPNDIDALRGIAQTFENAEKWNRAEYFYRKLIDMEPENPQHYRAMARVLLRQGDTDQAQEYFDKSKEL
jgi:tetratricopeptide (TPR) repeat protein